MAFGSTALAPNGRMRITGLSEALAKVSSNSIRSLCCRYKPGRAITHSAWAIWRRSSSRSASLPPGGRLVGRREVLVEEVPRALEIFEYPQILVGGLPRMRDEQSNWIVL